MRRVSENPPVRFPHRPIAEALLPWFVAHIKPRMEKAIADDCVRLNIEYYLPMTTKIIRRKDNNKPRKSIIPLFPGYICISGDKATYHSIYRTGRIARIIEIKHQKKFMAELGQIYSLLELGVPLEPCTELFAEGTEVMVDGGPLRGIRGIVTGSKSQNRVILSVEALGQAIMTVDGSILKAVD